MTNSKKKKMQDGTDLEFIRRLLDVSGGTTIATPIGVSLAAFRNTNQKTP